MKRRTPIHKSSRRILVELQELVAMCFLLIDEGDPREVANRTGLSVSTIRRLWSGSFTACVRWETVVKLAAGAGIDVAWVNDEIVVAHRR